MHRPSLHIGHLLTLSKDNRDHIIIKRWVSEYEQDILFDHTRKLKERKLLQYGRADLKKDAESMLVVRSKSQRKKSPIKRTSWFLT